MDKKNLLIFTDASLNPRTGTGMSGCLLLKPKDRPSTKKISHLPVKTKLFKNTNSARLELSSIILALNTVKKTFDAIHEFEITVYTDCKIACDLPSRRNRLEKSNYKSKSTTKPLNNADLYLEFFELFDELKPNLIWVKGHKARKDKNQIDLIFSHVDKTTRRMLREHQNKLNITEHLKTTITDTVN